MAKRTLQENINQVINDLNEIKSAIELKGVEVPAGTPTRDYSEKILNIETGVDVSADTVVAAALRAGFTAHEASGAAITGIIQNYEGAIVSGATPGAQAKYEEGYADGQASMPDLSNDTVTPDKLVLGETAHDASGAQITGTLDTEAIRAEGVEAGKKSEYDAFWDAFQKNGNRYHYNYAFFGETWTRQNFKPKYDIRLGSPSYGAGNGNMAFMDSGIDDIAAALKECGVVLDTSYSTNVNQMFQGSKTKTVPTISFASHRNPYCVFMNCAQLETIEKVIMMEGAHFDRWFNSCISLQNLTLEGTIAENGFDFHWSPLSKASLTSIVNALSTTTTGLTVTLRLDAVNNAFETSEGLADGSTSEEWLALAATKPNWTINLINS